MSQAIENAVIGGGPAGSAVAILLARQGREVCLLERKREAQHKVCGEFISWEAAHYLQALDIDLGSAGAVPITRMRLINGESERSQDLPFCAWSLSRKILDGLLLDAAAQNGVELRYGTAVRRVEHQDGRWHLQGPRDTTLAAQHCYLASGKHDLSAWRRPAPRQSTVGLKMHLQLPPAAARAVEQTVEVHLFPGGYAGIEPVENGKVNLCFLLERSLFRHLAGQQREAAWPQVLYWLAKQSSHMAQRLTGAISLWSRPLAVAGTPYGFVYRPAAALPELYRLGDQMAVIPSFTGDGIAMALHCAFLATHCRQVGEDAARYHREARRQLLGPVRKAQVLASVFGSPSGRAAAFQLARWPILLHSAIAQTRLRATRLI